VRENEDRLAAGLLAGCHPGAPLVQQALYKKRCARWFVHSGGVAMTDGGRRHA
jgi:hypothetical protein